MEMQRHPGQDPGCHESCIDGIPFLSSVDTTTGPRMEYNVFLPFWHLDLGKEKETKKVIAPIHNTVYNVSTLNLFSCHCQPICLCLLSLNYEQLESGR